MPRSAVLAGTLVPPAVTPVASAVVHAGPHPSAHPSAQPPTPATRHTIGELAREFDLTTRAIRFYEDVGLLQPQRSGRQRIYSGRDRTRLKLTLRGKRLGLSLQEIRTLVDMYESPADTAPQLQAFIAILAEHRHLLERQREDLDVTLAEIAQHEARCRALLRLAQQGSVGKTPARRSKEAA
jgi:DNA-binding transcriptional MerR regulator